MNIRLAKPKDISILIGLGSDVKEFETTKEVVTFWPRSILEDCVNSEDNPILVAEDNSEIIGFLIWNYNPLFKKAVIENIFVKKEFRGKSVGSRLLKEAKIRLLNLGCEYINGLTGIDYGVIDFYIKEGFNRGIDCAWLDLTLSDSFKKS